MVTAFGPGLEGGTTGVTPTSSLSRVLRHKCTETHWLISSFTGVPSDFIVNTCNAGSGALSVTIDGPSKVKMDCQECPEGYKVTYTPMAPGSYLISIKYGGPQHIVGSPFKAKVSGETSHTTVHYTRLFLLFTYAWTDTELAYTQLAKGYFICSPHYYIIVIFIINLTRTVHIKKTLL